MRHSCGQPGKRRGRCKSGYSKREDGVDYSVVVEYKIRGKITALRDRPISFQRCRSVKARMRGLRREDRQTRRVRCQSRHINIDRRKAIRGADRKTERTS